MAARYGRSRLIPLGLILAGLSAAALSLELPLLVPVLLVTLLSLGYDLTQPLLAGIVTDLGPNRGRACGGSMPNSRNPQTVNPDHAPDRGG
jgi:MFS family permease